MSKLGFVRPKACRNWICHMHMILFCLTVLQSAFPASWLLSLIPGIDCHLPSPPSVRRSLSEFVVGWLIQSLPQYPCGFWGLGGYAEALLCIEKPAGSFWGAERWPDTIWCYHAEYCCSSSFLPAGLPGRATCLTLRYFILPWRLFCLTPLTHLSEGLNAFFLFRPLSLAVAFL